MRRRALYLALGIPAGLLLFTYLTLCFVPNDALKGVVVRAAGNAGYTLDLAGFGKGFPLAVKARGVELSSQQGLLIKAADVRVGLELLPLFIGKPRVAYRGNIGTGEFSGTVTLGRKPGWSILAKGIRLEDIPFFGTVAGARVRGDLRLTGEVASVKGAPQGEVQLQVRGAELASVKLGEMPLPDATYQDVRGALSLDRGQAHLKSFTLTGDGIYVRLKGDVNLATPLGDSPLNLTLEMMPKPEFLDRQKFVFLMLVKYLTSPGAYTVPIHGSLAHPAL
ncbi:type II secretion system protein GspN [Geomonas limicola]|uniref:Type II secretion system protein GspN n=1 Tax=Geomonas limicola TaxID=2740186 RepID=A0A6V8NE24_9BACT|nr:type II secretion system protein GspN [Geomonas limicola]GFO69369.1 type II secretion system protein GspN [Geomonas limicola]